MHMNKGFVGLSFFIVGALVAALIGVLAPSGGGGKMLTEHRVQISDVINGACTIDPMPIPKPPDTIKSDNGDYVTWYQASNSKFTVTFPPGNTSTDTGSPFVNPFGSGWNTVFQSRDGTPVQTGQAKLAWLELKRSFYIQTITVSVNGADVTCYDRGKNPLEPMKVIINQ
jgi:hypothetical protein